MSAFSSLLTEPSLLVSLHLDRQAEVSQLDGSAFHLTGQQQVLGLRKVGQEDGDTVRGRR